MSVAYGLTCGFLACPTPAVGRVAALAARPGPQPSPDDEKGKSSARLAHAAGSLPAAGTADPQSCRAREFTGTES